MLNKLIFTTAMLIIAWHGQAQEQTVLTLKMKDASLKEIIERLEQQTDYSFIYNETVDLSFSKSVDIKEQKPEAALNAIFGKTGIEWKIRKKHIILTDRKTAAARKVTVSGYITDAESSEILIGTNIYDRISGTGTASNEFGFFSLTLPGGDAELRFSYTGYATETRKIDLRKNEKINISLRSNALLDEVVVVGVENRESGIEATNMSAMEVPLNILRTAPALLGETDVMKAIQMLPGVQAGTEGSAGIYVRGGGPDENLVLLDGIPLYNVDHLFGFFSVFTPEAVKKVTLYKGSFPSRFGGRLSSVIDVRTNDGDMYNYHGTVGIGLLSDKLQLEGPVWKGRTSFNVSARRSYLDFFAKLVMAKEDKLSYYFYDLNAKINHKFNDKSRLFLSLYNGSDTYDAEWDDSSDDRKATSADGLKWGNTLLAAKWNYIFSPKLFSNTTATLSQYRFNITSGFSERMPKYDIDSKTHYEYRSGIKDLTYRTDFDYYPSSGHHVKFGAGFLHHNFRPEVESSKYISNEGGAVTVDTYTKSSDKEIYAGETSVYAEDDMNVTPRLSLNAGLHFSLFHVGHTTYKSLQPRLAARYQLPGDFALKASYSKMNQYVHLLSNYTLVLPMDLWVPATDNIKPMRTHQYSLGAYYTGFKGWELSAESYYKDMRNVLEYKDGARFLGSSSYWEDKVEMGKGRAYGVELMAQKTTGKLTGWISYALAKSERKFQESGINQGRWFPYKYDRRHHINLTANYILSEKIDIGASWEFYTGGTTTLGEEKTLLIMPPGHSGMSTYYSMYGWMTRPISTVSEIDYIKGRNNYRLPPSHRLNVGINFHKKKKYGERIWSISIYNAYNAMNPTFIYRDAEYIEDTYTRKQIIKKITVLPIIPSFTYTYKF
ncbi:MAG: TonB-dependent receptor [Tannerella sp.]|jgi:outer membrane receptor for ferrienterochelin and colicin|nr:TonB-dependent receptor [Tannerella sp.]